jgi:DNA-binding response OmpR family regulator
MSYVLVVDDDTAICELLDIVLSEAGYVVECATTCDRALELARVRQPEVILFDMSLADGDGEHFVTSYRQLPRATARLVAVSGIAKLDEESARIGADGCLAKPFELADLLRIVRGSMTAIASA